LLLERHAEVDGSNLRSLDADFESGAGECAWLLAGSSDTNERLKHLATLRGIHPDRIIFAEKLANPQHLARYPLRIYFWIICLMARIRRRRMRFGWVCRSWTLPGRSFASRVCASVVQAAGIGELVCASPDDYIAQAVALGQDRAKLAAIKQKLISGRDTCRLFDTPLLVADLEQLFGRCGRISNQMLCQRPI